MTTNQTHKATPIATTSTNSTLKNPYASKINTSGNPYSRPPPLTRRPPPTTAFSSSYFFSSSNSPPLVLPTDNSPVNFQEVPFHQAFSSQPSAHTVPLPPSPAPPHVPPPSPFPPRSINYSHPKLARSNLLKHITSVPCLPCQDLAEKREMVDYLGV